MIRSLRNLNIVDEAESLCQKLLRAGKRIVGSEKCVAAGLLRVRHSFVSDALQFSERKDVQFVECAERRSRT